VADFPDPKTPLPPLDDGAAIADAARDPERHARLAAAIEQLTPEEAIKVLDVLEREMKMRSLQLYGYILSGIVLIIGMLGVLVYWGSVPEGTPIAWTIPMPFLLVGIILFVFGRWANRAGGRRVGGVSSAHAHGEKPPTTAARRGDRRDRGDDARVR
jgi:hypothetical protein